jgi:hypothetical protein
VDIPLACHPFDRMLLQEDAVRELLQRWRDVNGIQLFSLFLTWVRDTASSDD